MPTPPIPVSGTPIDTTWGTQVANSLVNVFASEGARSSAITSPTTGMATYISSNNVHEGMYVYNSAGEWAPSWHMGWGIVDGGRVAVASDQVISTSLTDVSGTAMTSIDLVTDRYWLVMLGCQIVDTSGSANDITFTLTTSANSILATFPTHKLAAANQFENFSSFVVVNTNGLVSSSWKIRAEATANGVRLNNDTYTLRVLLIDIGPSGAPS